MKYVSIDLETTGLSSEKHQILTFSGILEDTTKLLFLGNILMYGYIK